MTSLCKVILAGALLISAAPAYAEDAHHPSGTESEIPPILTPMPEGQQDIMGMMSGRAMPMMGQMMAPERIEGRIAFLRTELKITDAQQPLWIAFAEALRANAQAVAGMMAQMQGMMMPAPGTVPSPLPQRIEDHERMLAAHLDALRQLKAALQPLYAAFDDRQKRTADQLLMPGPMGRM